MRVVHCRADKEDEIAPMHGSKYVQSRIDSEYCAIENDVKSEREILFCGTPCQIAAVNSYLRERKLVREKIVLCSIVCHGVNSPLIWQKYLNFIGEKTGKIQGVNMRDKQYGAGYNMTITGEKKTYHRKGDADPFIKIFTKNLALRRSCFHCPGKDIHQVSDITIGDFHYANKFYPEYCDGQGISVVLVNTKKGEKIFDLCLDELEYKLTTREKAMQPNLECQIPEEFENGRDKFFQHVHSLPFVDVLKRYTEVGAINRCVGGAKRLVKKIIGRE